ncbi:uncharacterized protein LOC133881409 isoform X2 [Alnus glutinosa]|uniref:uncharacterized protein LOC133881409 isoform X2 n=1 Tax=Alnus glutinosa TaxID=3517 RepID=UPI002D795A93|nr:uncharacterized protein LOC133881409 isoform X2 [Alnus glutinosa]
MSDGLDLVLPLGEAAETFQLEKAVCSHGLFMMAPNQWDPLSKTQVSRMLRLSETEERAAREFRKMCTNGAETDGSFGGIGRVFRSPTLFEDMVKCILLCNCQWSRTLSMARALCELQLELQSRSSCMSSTETGGSVTEASNTNSKSPKTENEDFVPKTPVGKETKTKLKASKVSTNLTKLAETEAELGANAYFRTDSVQTKAENLSSNVLPTNVEDDSCQNCKSCQATGELYKTDSCLLTVLQCFEGQESDAYGMVGNFPSPRELANLDESLLRTRCNLGYRASRILKLAQGIVEGRIQLTQLEEACKGASLSSYNMLDDQLKGIDGFGPFTCANVLMCMGFYHVIPTDSETIRHLRQVHARKSNSQTVQRDVEYIYGKYAPFQFLAYWSELWHFYEKRFGKLSEMPCSDYHLITASNMRIARGKSKRKRI